MSDSNISSYYIVTYRNPEDEKVLQLKARDICDSMLGLGFVSISDFVFPNQKSVVVDPSEEYLVKRLENVKSMHLNIYSILSIEEVGEENEGLSLKADRSNLVLMSPRSPEQPTC